MINYGYNTYPPLPFFFRINNREFSQNLLIPVSLLFSMKYYRVQDYTKQVRIGNIICLARTYKEHAREMNAKLTEDPLLFLKPSSSVIFNHGTIKIPQQSQCLHHEVELGVIIGRKGKHITKEDALQHILGYLVALDITARDIQSNAKKNGWPWTIAKGFDTFAPLSDAVLKEKVPHPQNLDLMLKINGVVKQSANTNQMVYSLERIISFISDIMTLERGDLILTGTPEGVGELKEGDVLEASLGSLCYLTVDVQQETKT
jgi:2-keto-4-pentenoate hydratase/2-oxohepta-3-ene-1,7-dioic acid hydratase in catechol pathway